MRFYTFVLTPESPSLVLLHTQSYSKAQVTKLKKSFVERHFPFNCKATSKESTLTLHSFFPGVKNPIEKAQKSSDECENLPFSLGRGWLLLRLVVFPFLLPTAVCLLWIRQRNQEYSYTFCCPLSFFHTVGNWVRSLSLSLNAEFICLRLSGVMLHWTYSTALIHCTQGELLRCIPLKQKVCSFSTEKAFSLSTDRAFLQLQQHGSLVGFVWVAS